MKIGSNDISKIYLGTEEIGKIYLGSEVVYEASAPVVDIGKAYYVSNGAEVANNAIFNEEVLLLKQPPYNSGFIDGWDSTKPFKISVKNVIVNNHSSIGNILRARLAGGLAQIGINTSGYLKYFCNYGNSAMDSNIVALTDGAAYDIEIEYDGIGSVIGRAKLSSSDIWDSQTYSYTITSTPTDYTAIRIGATNATININDVYVENNNIIRFQR